MTRREIHSWNVTPTEAIALQRRLAIRISEAPLTYDVRYIAGGDCAFAHNGMTLIAGWVVWDLAHRCIVEEVASSQPCYFPYVPGLLSFREAPGMLNAARQLKTHIDAYMVDGQGRAHPRRIGLASHLGLWLDRPTVGCGKSRLCGEFVEPGMRRGASRRLVHQGETIGRVVRTRDGIKPLFVSVGHRVTLDDAVRLVLKCGNGYRLPEPTRLADQLVARYKRELEGN